MLPIVGITKHDVIGVDILCIDCSPCEICNNCNVNDIFVDADMKIIGCDKDDAKYSAVIMLMMVRVMIMQILKYDNENKEIKK